MKTVHAVEYGCNLDSEPLEDSVAEELKKKLEAKGLQCHTEFWGEFKKESIGQKKAFCEACGKKLVRVSNSDLNAANPYNRVLPEYDGKTGSQIFSYTCPDEKCRDSGLKSSRVTPLGVM